MFLSDFVCKFGLTSYVDLQVLLCMFLTLYTYMYVCLYMNVLMLYFVECSFAKEFA